MPTTIEQTINYLKELSTVFDFKTTLSMIHDKYESCRPLYMCQRK